jgi:hypothetical protein
MNMSPNGIHPNKKYTRRLPNLDFVLSDIIPIIGSVIASHARAIKKIKPAHCAGIPATLTRKYKR